MVDFSPIVRELREIYESKTFPLFCLVGGVLLDALTNDFLWVLFGIAGFVVFLFKRKGLK